MPYLIRITVAVALVAALMVWLQDSRRQVARDSAMEQKDFKAELLELQVLGY